MAKRSIIFVESPFAKSDIQLGSLVPSRSRPDIDAVSPITVSEADISRKEDGDFADKWNSSSSAAFTAMLTKLFSLSLKSDPSAKIELRALPGKDGLKSFVYTLKNPRGLLKRLCEISDVHELLEGEDRMGRKVWLVVEYRTLENASVVLADRKSDGAAGKAVLPVAEAVGAQLPDRNADIAMEGKYEKTSEKETKFVAMGERVFAVGCRRVRLGRWNKNDVALDDKIFWKSAFNRGESAESFTVADLDDKSDEEGNFDVIARISLRDEVFLKLASD